MLCVYDCTSNKCNFDAAVLVQKKDGSPRFLCGLPETKCGKNAYPLPRIDETLEALGGSLALDGSPHWTCYQGCWQVEMNLVDRLKTKTAFATWKGIYEFKACHFIGLCNEPTNEHDSVCRCKVPFLHCDKTFNTTSIKYKAFLLYLQSGPGL